MVKCYLIGLPSNYFIGERTTTGLLHYYYIRIYKLRAPSCVVACRFIVDFFFFWPGRNVTVLFHRRGTPKILLLNTNRICLELKIIKSSFWILSWGFFKSLGTSLPSLLFPSLFNELKSLVSVYSINIRLILLTFWKLHFETVLLLINYFQVIYLIMLFLYLFLLLAPYNFTDWCSHSLA